MQLTVSWLFDDQTKNVLEIIHKRRIALKVFCDENLISLFVEYKRDFDG